ncbi:aquaporin-like protein [Rhodocollybia butyracea]|uniref:Aquaporin-like protein n=1 Tax=Rhodocollybia butyracea TaxID=206335 RepID=A0A9P5Q956_9AGAR|nr:aquaporin-like protein [Rhodocollybia butyracea]
MYLFTLLNSISGGHFNPATSVALVIFRGFPPLKAIRYIIAQILGSYVACLLIHAQWYAMIKESELALASVNLLESTLFTSTGPAGAFAVYVLPRSSLARVFLNEFVTDTLLAIVRWGSLDPTSLIVPPSSAPWVFAMALCAAIWGSSGIGLAINPARDLGGRLAAVTIYGKAAIGGKYAAIAALTAFPATIFGVLLYEIFLADYARGESIQSLPSFFLLFFN